MPRKSHWNAPKKKKKRNNVLEILKPPKVFRHYVVSAYLSNAHAVAQAAERAGLQQKANQGTDIEVILRDSSPVYAVQRIARIPGISRSALPSATQADPDYLVRMEDILFDNEPADFKKPVFLHARVYGRTDYFMVNGIEYRGFKPTLREFLNVETRG